MTIWFTADTHFSSERTLELSRRPFEDVIEMDSEIIKRWNEVVSEDDTVYHLGDIGALGLLSFCNYKKFYLVRGNYDTDESLRRFPYDKRKKIIPQNYKLELEDITVTLIHEPEMATTLHAFYLFGHIHQLQMVKRNGLNVGVDCHQFKPINVETVLFYNNAIWNHYDENVFIEELGRKE